MPESAICSSWEGGPCPVCNPHGFVQWKEIYATTDAERDKPLTSQ